MKQTLICYSFPLRCEDAYSVRGLSLYRSQGHNNVFLDFTGFEEQSRNCLLNWHKRQRKKQRTMTYTEEMQETTSGLGGCENPNRGVS